MVLTLLALAAGGAVFLGADNLRIAVRDSVDRIFASQRYDFVLRLADAYPAGKIEAAAASVTGVERVEAWSSDTASIAHTDDTLGNAFRLVGVAPDSAMLAPLLDGGRWLDAADRNVLVISRTLLKDEPALTPGTEATLMIDGRIGSWRIAGVVDAGTQSLAFAPRATLAALHHDDLAPILVVAADTRNEASQLDLILRLRAQLERDGMPAASSQSVIETRRSMEDHLLMVVDFLGVMAWVMIVVGGMGLASTMSLAVLERTREIGVLRAIGARHGAILRMIMTEGLVIAVLGWLVSMPLSMPMSRVLADAFGRIMFATPVRYLPDAGGVLRWLALIVAVSMLACVWPAWRATRIPTAAALSYE